MGVSFSDLIALVLVAGLALSIIAGMVYGTILLIKKLLGPKPEDS